MVGVDTSELSATLAGDGVVAVPAVVPRELALRVAEECDETVNRLAENLGRPLETYLRSASVWRCRSPVAARVRVIEGRAGDLVSALLGRTVAVVRTNVIRKSRLAPRATPWHQDAPYAWRDPYVLTTWLALDDADVGNGMLRFLPGTHHGPASPKTDYWRPDFVDQRPATATTEVAFPVSAGDVLVFDPLVWHASTTCSSGRRRWAVSTRWSWPGYSWSVHLPVSPEVRFGMSNAARVTERVLRSAHERLMGPAPVERAELLSAWRLGLSEAAPPGVDVGSATDALARLETLDLASRQHDAGDQDGQVYLDVWHSLLVPLQRRLESPHAP